MKDCEFILLDCRLESVLETHAFRAALGNGHEFTAYVAVRDRKQLLPVVGDCVEVEMSPFNMNAGRIII